MGDRHTSHDDGFFAWLHVLRTATELTAVLEQRLHAQVGLTLSRYEVLVTLRRAAAQGRRLTMQQLADAVFFSKSGLTRLVATLENDGLVRRCTPPANRRITYADLTDAGTTLIDAAAPLHRTAVTELFSNHLSNHESACITTALRKVLNAPPLDAG